MNALHHPAVHYSGLLRAVLADKLVDALAVLEQAHVDADQARRFCGPGDQQKCDLAELDARVEVFRIMDQLGFNARIMGSALA